MKTRKWGFIHESGTRNVMIFKNGKKISFDPKKVGSFNLVYTMKQGKTTIKYASVILKNRNRLGPIVSPSGQRIHYTAAIVIAKLNPNVKGFLKALRYIDKSYQAEKYTHITITNKKLFT